MGCERKALEPYILIALTTAFPSVLPDVLYISHNEGQLKYFWTTVQDEGADDTSQPTPTPLSSSHLTLLRCSTLGNMALALPLRCK